MAKSSGQTTDTVKFFRLLEEAPYQYNFFKALRRLEGLYPEKPRLGKAARPRDEPVRFGQLPSLAFAPSTLSYFKQGVKGAPPRLGTNFFGVFGPNAPLPRHLTEYAQGRIKNHNDETFVRFMDIFHHRMLSLFYRARASTEPTYQFDRPADDKFNFYVGSLIGLKTDGLQQRDAVSVYAKLHYAGLLVGKGRHKEGLNRIIGDFFGLPSTIQEFIGEWLTLPVASRCQLGKSKHTCLLGRNTVLGSRVWERQTKFRVVMGPLDFDDYLKLLPGRDTLSRLTVLIRDYIGDELDWDLNLILKKEAVPGLQLNKEKSFSAQLGWTTWLMKDKPESDASDLILTPMK
ncbi:MAG: type VI secretion system baseplate subunit TssG [Gammaproteobacteria bacterium]|nr:MAG: type VI secretion system baseplate subunit TssG [Gammaproteobacteria bacterium]